MDKIPKFRRKPKPPAIETGVGRSSTDAESAESSTVLSEPSPSPALRQIANDENKHKHLPSGMRSPFRNLRMRSSAKRARDASPAGSISGQPPTLPPIPASDGVKVVKNDHSPRHSSVEEHDADGLLQATSHSHQPPKMPAYLNLSDKEIDIKYNDLVWKERNRAAGSDWRFKSTETKETMVMDRYANIKPWNHNRIRLRVPEDQLDYVNASTITLDSPSYSHPKPLRYIAMQGPTEPSFPYVWRMIAEQAPSEVVIVQLTSFFEGIHIKCHQYFPDSEEKPTWDLNEEDIWGDQWKSTLTYDSSESLADGAIEKRKLLLHVAGEENPRIVWHFLYEQWPDFGTPSLDDMAGFFELIKLSREHSAPDAPRIIHCSAGVGRTGTLITLEHLIRELEAGGLCDPPPSQELEGQPQKKTDLIYETVDLLREQRRGMVQGTVQYKFIYQVMNKLWQEKYGQPDDEGEDEDMTDGGVSIPTPTTSEKPTGTLLVLDPFYDPDNNADDDDNDEGGAEVKPRTTPRR